MSSAPQRTLRSDLLNCVLHPNATGAIAAAAAGVSTAEADGTRAVADTVYGAADSEATPLASADDAVVAHVSEPNVHLQRKLDVAVVLLTCTC